MASTAIALARRSSSNLAGDEVQRVLRTAVPARERRDLPGGQCSFLTATAPPPSRSLGLYLKVSRSHAPRSSPRSSQPTTCGHCSTSRAAGSDRDDGPHRVRRVCLLSSRLREVRLVGADLPRGRAAVRDVRGRPPRRRLHRPVAQGFRGRTGRARRLGFQALLRSRPMSERRAGWACASTRRRTGNSSRASSRKAHRGAAASQSAARIARGPVAPKASARRRRSRRARR